MYTQHQPQASALPPWERRHLEQVPYQAKHQSPQLGANDSTGGFEDQRHQHDSRTRNPASYPPQQYAGQQQHCSHTTSPYSSTPAAAQHYQQQQQHTTPGHSHAQKMTQAQAFATPRDPPTPPYSTHSSATNSPPLGAPQPQAAALASLPGTMSTRERKPSRSQSNGPAKSDREHQRKNSTKSEKSGFGSRLKTTFKDMFKRDPIDESEFERIDRRHWADDD